jgi:parallel beta-helix repeat protein
MGGILLFNSTDNIIVNNTIMYNRLFGITVTFYSNNNTISNNLILKNKSTVFNETTDGIRLEYYATANRIVGNIISENLNGIRILLSNTNQIYHNNFINNTLHEYSELSINSWDNGNEGNYWSEYTGEDTNGDGVGDTPYIIDVNNKDNYPLMTPYVFP